MKMNPVRKRLDAGEKMDRDELISIMEGFRNRTPVVYNIETTNACNMKCEMCPRTTMMTRPIETMGRETFIRIVDQLKPFEEAKWQEWESGKMRESAKQMRQYGLQTSPPLGFISRALGLAG